MQARSSAPNRAGKRSSRPCSPYSCEKGSSPTGNSSKNSARSELLEGQELGELHREHRVPAELQLSGEEQLHAGRARILVEGDEVLVGDGDGAIGRAGAGLARRTGRADVDLPLAALRPRDVHLVGGTDRFGLF